MYKVWDSDWDSICFFTLSVQLSCGCLKRLVSSFCWIAFASFLYKDHLSMFVWKYFQIIYYVPLIYASSSLIVTHGLYYYSYIVSLKIIYSQFSPHPLFFFFKGKDYYNYSRIGLSKSITVFVRILIRIVLNL